MGLFFICDTVGEFKQEPKILEFDFNFWRLYSLKMNSPTVSIYGNLPIIAETKRTTALRSFEI